MSKMHFVPIRTIAKGATREEIEKSDLYRTRAIWGPFISRIADRGDETEDELFDHVWYGRVQIGIVWDNENKQARALVGMMYSKQGRELVGEVRWVTGFGTKDWRDLLPELEKYLKEFVGCTIVKPICRPGWKPFLKQMGYRQTHVVLEKML